MGEISKGGDMIFIVEKTEVFKIEAPDEIRALEASLDPKIEPALRQVIISTEKEE